MDRPAEGGNRESPSAKPGCIFIGTTLSDNPVAAHFRALADELVNGGHQVVLLTPHRKTELECHEGNPAIYSWPSERPTKFRDAIFLRTLIHRFRPQCVIANFAAVNMMTVVGWFTRVSFRIAFYRTLTSQIALDGRPVPRLKELRKRLVYGLASHVVTNSAASAADVQREYSVPKTKCFVFRNSLSDPTPAIPEGHDLPALSHVLCVGRCYPSKGQDVAIRAVARMNQAGFATSIDFVGEGPARSHYERLARELNISSKCRFLGRLPHPEVIARMAAAPVTLVPSRSEAFGIVTIESMAVGTPVIASAVGGLVEIVRDGIDGFLVPPDDPNALADRLILVLTDRSLRTRLGAAARDRFLARFEQKLVVCEQVDVLQEMLSMGPLSSP